MNDKQDILMTHILYIKEKVDKCENHLDKINGRVRANERMVGKIISIGSTFAFLITVFLSYMGIKK